MKQQTNLLILFVLLFNINVLAKSTDENAPLHIEADELEIHEKDGTSIYKGNVKINKGSIKITGDKIIITNENGSLHHVRVNGRPATFYQLNDLDEAINAESYQMDYKAKTGILELKEKAILIKNKNHFSSEHIIYNTLKDIVRAGNHNAPSTQQIPRVKITIYPENTKKQTLEKN